MNHSSHAAPATATEPVAASCLQCGTPTRSLAARFCPRCGLALGAPPRPDATLLVCPTCYEEVADDGLISSPLDRRRRVPFTRHVEEHERVPVGDDEWLESLRDGYTVRVGRWRAPFDIVRRYLVTGVVSAGRRRTMEHDVIVAAMTQIARWGPAPDIVGDLPEWQEAREAVATMMERYHRAAKRS